MAAHILPYELTAPMTQGCFVEVYLGEGIWWRMKRSEMHRYPGIKVRPSHDQ